MARIPRLPRRGTLLLVLVTGLLAIPQAGYATAILAGHAPAGLTASGTAGQPARQARVTSAATGARQHPAAGQSARQARVTSAATGARQASANPAAPGARQRLAAGDETVHTTAAAVAGSSGGLCSVPGIGDIGGLLGFCSLGSSGLTGDLNNICQPSLPDPEPADSGIDALAAPPASGRQPATLYGEYGVAGDSWAATNLQCSDMTSLIGNNVAGMVFDAAKSIDRVTITVYQAAAGNGILSWLRNVTDRLISALGSAIYFPYVALVVIIGAIWLAWQGLIRKRGTRTVEGTVWMVVACAAAIFLIGRPADVTGLGTDVSDGMTQALNAAFARLPSPGPSSCVPVGKNDPQVRAADYAYTSGNSVVAQNANQLWTVLVCEPWLAGEFGTTSYAQPGDRPTAINKYGRQLLWAQAIAMNEKPTQSLIRAKQATYAGIASSIQRSYPGIYPLFQGNQWTTRLEIAFAALFAAVVAGLLVLLISVTLILLKLGFLLLLIVGPFFLLVGTHPGFGRVVAVRWLELLVGVLLKQAAVALVLSVLLYCYALIMGTSGSALPWALKVLMIALVTVAAFLFRRPFQHLFSAVGYGVIGSRERSDAELARAGAAARENAIGAATAVPAFAAYRAARWARRNPGQATGVAAAAATGGGTGVATAATAAARGLAGKAANGGQNGAGTAGAADGVNGSARAAAADGATGGAGSADGAPALDGAPPSFEGSGRAGLGGRRRAWAAAAGNDAAGEPPPLNLPSRGTPASPGGPAAGPARAAFGGRSAAPARSAPARSAPARSAPAQPVAARPGAAQPGAAGPASAPAGSWWRSAGRGVWPQSRSSAAQPGAAASPPRAASARAAGQPRPASQPRPAGQPRPASQSRAASQPPAAGRPRAAASPPGRGSGRGGSGSAGGGPWWSTGTGGAARSPSGRNPAPLAGTGGSAAQRRPASAAPAGERGRELDGDGGAWSARRYGQPGGASSGEPGLDQSAAGPAGAGSSPPPLPFWLKRTRWRR
jgi:hypothetical protein